MKKDVFIFILNTVIAVSLTGTAINVLPFFGERIGQFSQSLVAAASPVAAVSNIKVKFSNENKKDFTNNDNTNNTTSGKSEEAMHRITGKDSDLFSDIAKTPSDIAKLMAKKEKTIKDEKKIGKTSEEDYKGGGTIISFGSVAIQSKIPSSFYKPDIETLLKQKAELSIADSSQPTVLIYHSHTTESYTLLDAGYYTKTDDARSNSDKKNMVRVGDDICEYLEKQGIGVIHDREIHDENYTGAYKSSRKSVEKYLEQYPTIEITIDVHRDDITYDNKTKVKPTAVINGKKAARMMLIAGCEYGRVKKFDNWECNLRFDLAVQNQIESMYPGLMRPILFSERIYNMDETKNSFLLEIGTDANTLDEACYSGRLFAAALGQMIKNDYSKE